MRNKVLGIISIFLLNLSFAFAQIDNQVEEEIYEGVNFPMKHWDTPNIKNQDFLITDFGGLGDGIFKNTVAFKQAISQATEVGGGKIIVPRGIWLTGPIELKSGINLHLEAGAVLLFSRDFDDYPLIETSYEGLNSARSTSPIFANNAENIAITGSGVIDGNGQAWRPVKKSKMTDHQWRDLIKSGGVLSENKSVWYPSKSALKGSESDLSSFSLEELKEVKAFLRPVMVSLVNCKNILLDGPTFQNSPAWNIHPLMSENIIIRNLNIRNPWYAQNGDGLDIESCKNVLVYNNTFDVGDDAICVKSGKDKDGRDRGIPTQNVIIKNNTVYHGHGGFVIGSEMSGGVKNVHISDCNFIGTDTGLRFKSTRGRGGVVEDIYISNINMTGIATDAIRFNLYYGGKAPDLSDLTNIKEDEDDYPEVSIETPAFKNIYMDNIQVIEAESAGYFMGLPEMNLENIKLENSKIQAKKGMRIINADGITFNSAKLITEEIPIKIHNVKNVDFSELFFESDFEKPIQISGSKTAKIELNFNEAGKSFDLQEGLQESQIIKIN
ncbi:Polygalacturonase [Zunongwangia mangrovi]|uniref:Polygalacturonase n=1 Tax=Zunongwangia mangrovi TaxID=1334022 RepID=A0A1I1LIC2_9FLAO|nr:glycoside hydrolase family 28 protein [Zunongwangia mangrovi]SFC72789.1 Polygalacturonase [Zunongwangia mangrovi]